MCLLKVVNKKVEAFELTWHAMSTCQADCSQFNALLSTGK